MICTACKYDLPESEFSYRTDRGHFDSRCKICVKLHKASRVYRHKCWTCGIEFISENAHATRESCAACKEAKNIQRRSYAMVKRSNDLCGSCFFWHVCSRPSRLWDYNFELPCFECSPYHQQYRELEMAKL